MCKKTTTNISIFIVGVFLFFNFQMFYDTAENQVSTDVVDSKRFIWKVKQVQWTKRTSKTFDEAIPLDTFEIINDSLGRKKHLRILVHRENTPNYMYDSIFYNYYNRDTLPDWVAYSHEYRNRLAVDTTYGIHTFDSLGRIEKERLYNTKYPHHELTKYHYYDTLNRPIEIVEYDYRSKLKEQINYEYLDSFIVKKRVLYSSGGGIRQTYIDSLYFTDGKEKKLYKKVRFYDYAGIRKTNKRRIEDCWNCTQFFNYMPTGQLASIVVAYPYPSEQVDSVVYQYNAKEQYLGKTEYIDRDTIRYLYDKTYNEFDDWIEYRKYKNNELIEVSKRELIYAEI